MFMFKTFASVVEESLESLESLDVHNIIKKECVKSVSGIQANETLYLPSQFRLFR